MNQQTNKSDLPALEFGQDWNGGKLKCNHFTSIRLHNPKKYAAGKQFRILLNNKPLGVAEVMVVHNFLLHDLTDYTAFLDTGYNKEGCTNIILGMYKSYNLDYSTQLFDLVVLKYIERFPEPITITQERTKSLIPDMFKEIADAEKLRYELLRQAVTSAGAVAGIFVYIKQGDVFKVSTEAYGASKHLSAAAYKASLKIAELRDDFKEIF